MSAAMLSTTCVIRSDSLMSVISRD